MEKKNIIRVAVITVCLLLIPLIAMQFTDEIKWTLFDFVIAGVLLFGTGFINEFVRSKMTSRAHRLIFSAGVLVALLIVWGWLATS